MERPSARSRPQSSDAHPLKTHYEWFSYRPKRPTSLRAPVSRETLRGRHRLEDSPRDISGRGCHGSMCPTVYRSAPRDCFH